MDNIQPITVNWSIQSGQTQQILKLSEIVLPVFYPKQRYSWKMHGVSRLVAFNASFSVLSGLCHVPLQRSIYYTVRHKKEAHRNIAITHTIIDQNKCNLRKHIYR